MKQPGHFDEEPLPDEVELRGALIALAIGAALFAAWWLFGDAAVIPAVAVAIGALGFGIWRSISARLAKKHPANE